ncbi:MAG TPA: DNA-binding transcriptional regulator [Tepidisphaeraceae bacterium]|jgi:LacI family transcriptional regulator
MAQPKAIIRHVALVVELAVASRRRMLSGIARYIQEHERWAVYLQPFGNASSLPEWLRSWKGDGIITSVKDLDRKLFVRRGIPVVDAMGGHRLAGIPEVYTNNRAVGRLGAEHLLERGFFNLAFCEYLGEFWSTERREGFEAALAEKKIPSNVLQMPVPVAGGDGDESWEDQHNMLMEWLKGLPKPVGIMATNDMMGQQLLEACQRQKISVPRDVGIVGADDDEPICRIAVPPLSSVIINDEQRGYEAAALLDRMMAGQAPPEGPVYIEPGGVRTRGSTDVIADDLAVVKALRYLKDNACEHISVDDVVRQVPLSRSVLERRFRKFVGRSINNEMVRLRLNRAMELLSETNLELKVIAQQAGFGTQSYMNAVFKDKLGRTPGSFRAVRPAGRKK